MAKGKPSQDPFQSPMEDHSSPYFLHNGDHPSLSLVSLSLVGSGSNYHSWRRSMVTTLNAKNKLGFIDGTISRPAATDLLAGPWSQQQHEIARASFIMKQPSKYGMIYTNDFIGSGPRIFELKQKFLLTLKDR
ncbi:hypothetical protein AAG906_004071 [Vitis piasezkii]